MTLGRGPDSDEFDTAYWQWLEELPSVAKAPGDTPVVYVKRLGESTRAEIKRLERQSARANTSLREELGNVKEAVAKVPEAVAKLAFDQAYQEREDRRQSREQKTQLIRYFFSGLFAVVKLPLESRWFVIMLGLALLVGSLGFAGGQMGITFDGRSLSVFSGGEPAPSNNPPHAQEPVP